MYRAESARTFLPGRRRLAKPWGMRVRSSTFGSWATPALVGLLAMTLLAAPGALARQQSSILIDYETGEVLSSEEPDATAYPASLTKIMTLYLTFDALEKGRLQPDSRLRVSARAAAMPPTKLGLERGSTISVEDAVMALVTRSANDVATVLAEGLGGSEDRFADRMTTMARRLGMRSTTFQNASGLPDRAQQTTARDMSILGRRLIRDFPAHYRHFGKRQFAYRGRKIGNHNRLLGVYDGADGIKTGYTRGSGYNLVASAVRNGRRLIGVVLGGDSAGKRDRRMVAMLDQGFARKPAPVLVAASPPTRDLPPAPIGVVPIERPTLAAEAPPLPAEGDDATTPTLPAEEEVSLASASLDEAVARPSARPDRVRTASRRSTTRRTVPYGVHVGVFSSLQEARRSVQFAVRRAPTQLRGTFASIQGVKSRRAVDYRAQLIGLSRDSAAAACRALRKHRQSCTVVRSASVAVARN